jgi:hypothetical protein
VRRTLAIGPSDGRYVEATAPVAPATARTGQAVTVRYDVSNVTGTDNPQLVVSTVGHWNPVAAPIFSAAWHQALTMTTGTVTIPASAFHGGGGIYGIGIVQAHFGGIPRTVSYGGVRPHPDRRRHAGRPSRGTADHREERGRGAHGRHHPGGSVLHPAQRCFARLKQYRAIATRYDKTALSYQGMIDLATLLIWL